MYTDNTKCDMFQYADRIFFDTKSSTRSNSDRDGKTLKKLTISKKYRRLGKRDAHCIFFS